MNNDFLFEVEDEAISNFYRTVKTPPFLEMRFLREVLNNRWSDQSWNRPGVFEEV